LTDKYFHNPANKEQNCRIMVV